MFEQRQIVDDAFAETEARIDSDPRDVDAGLTACRDARREELADFGHDIVVVRRVLHGARFALHVHETNAGTAYSRPRRSRPARQRADIIDDVRARFAGRPHDLGLAGVDGNEDRRFAPQDFHDGDDARELFVDNAAAAPGRVDSPPMSMMAAPSSIMRRAWLERRGALR